MGQKLAALTRSRREVRFKKMGHKNGTQLKKGVLQHEFTGKNQKSTPR